MSELYDEREEIVQATDTDRLSLLGDSLHLGPLDHVSSEFVYLAVCFVYVSEVSLNRLRTALIQTLNRYPHLTGRVRIDQLGNRSIDRFGTGALLQSAASRTRLSSARDEAGKIDINRLPDAGRALLPSPHSSDETGGPLLSVKMTSFGDGSGTVLGIGMPHSVCDATAFFAVVAHLTRAYSTCDSHSHHSGGSQVSDTLSLPYRSLADIQAGSTGSHFPMRLEPEATATSSGSVPHIEGRFLHFDDAYLQKLKAAAKPADDMTSKYRALTAHLWQTSHRAARVWAQRQTASESAGMHELDPQDFATARLTIAVNLRKRLPSVPVDLIYNATLPCSMAIPLDVLQAADLKVVAQEINMMLRQDLVVNPSTMASAIRWIDEQEDKTRVDFGWDNCMVSTQWPSDMYITSELDGVRPDLVCLPILPGMPDGLLIILPPPVSRSSERAVEVVTEGEGLVAMLCLDKRTWGVIDDLDLLHIERLPPAV